jgi:DNA-binding response OmpR family regulator
VQKQLENVSILVIEDEPIIALDLQYLLESSGAAPVTLEHAIEGARQRLSGPALPDVVILDLVLGGTSSLPLAEELRHKRVPFLFLTGDAIGIPSGFSDVQAIQKPYAVDQLITAVGQVANNHK